MRRCKPLQHHSEPCLGIVLFWVWVLMNCCTGLGCRSFVQGKSNSQLVQARQLSLRGADALQRSRQQDAELLFAEALRNSPLDERAHWGYATTLWQRGDRQRAIEHMREAVRLSGRNPEYSGRNPEYAVRLGEMNLDMGDRSAARQYALEVLSANRSNAEAWALLGDTHQSERDWSAALECYHHALLKRSDYPRVQLVVAEIYRSTGRPQRTLAALDRMADLHPAASTDPESLLIRGMALTDLDRSSEAAVALAMASERMPSDRIDKQIQLVQAQHRIGELVPARMTLGRLIASKTNNPEVERLQSMLDMSFSQLSDPSSISRNGGLLAIQEPPPQNSLQNTSNNSGTQNTTRIASPMLNNDSASRLRR